MLSSVDVSLALRLLRPFDMLVNRIPIWPETLVEIPIGLTHIDSDFCWCDPIAEIDEAGQDVLIHKEVTWN